MKILYIFDHFNYNVNYRDVAYAREMAKNHEVYVLTSNYTSDKKIKKPSYEKWRGVTIIRGDPVMEFRGTMFWIKNFKKIIKSINPDVIHTFEGIKISTSIMGCWAKTQGYPMVYDQENRMSGGWSPLTRLKYFLGGGFFEKKIVKIVDLIRVVTPGSKEYLMKKYHIPEDKIVSSTLGYNQEEIYYSEKLRRKFRKEKGFTSKSYVIATTGRLTKLKKIEWIIEAFKQINDKEIYLIVTGKIEQDYFNFLKQKYKDVPRLIVDDKYLGSKDLNELYNGVDLLVWQHATISYFEALATKTPILIPYFNATSHLENVKGVFYYGRDKKIFDKYEGIINDKERIEEMAKIMKMKPVVKGIDAKKFSWENIAESLEKDYMRVLKNIKT